MAKIVYSLGGLEGVALRAAQRAGFVLGAADLSDQSCPEALCLVLEGVGARSVQQTDWDAEVMEPLDRCFDLIRAVGRKMRARDWGRLVAVIPACALRPVQSDGQINVLARALLGLMEGLRAELQETGLAVSILFHDGEAEEEEAALADRLTKIVETGDFYRLSRALDRRAIQAYFEPILLALSETTSGPPLPDIGPMAAVYLQKV